MARPREFDPKAALQSAIEVFWEKGYCDASVNEVVRRSGVAKYGIYGAFGTKRELFIQALQQYGEDRCHDIQWPIREPNASLPQIEKFFRNAYEWVMHKSSNRRGCLLCNTGIELGAQDPEVRSIVTAYFDDLADVFNRCLKRAVENKEIALETDVERLAKFLTTEYRLLVMLAASGEPYSELETSRLMSASLFFCVVDN